MDLLYILFKNYTQYYFLNDFSAPILTKPAPPSAPPRYYQPTNLKDLPRRAEVTAAPKDLKPKESSIKF